MPQPIAQVRKVLQSFQDGYAARELDKLDEFMHLFAPGDETELIGIGASTRNGYEWFEGYDRIREIIKSDWEYWGDVRLDVENAKITVKGDVAWLSTVGQILQTDHIHSDDVTASTLGQMKELLEDEKLSPRDRLVEASHFGVRRWREREKPAGYVWPFVLTAVLVKDGASWRFHTLHWSMPVD
jgi:hypothetical protein